MAVLLQPSADWYRLCRYRQASPPTRSRPRHPMGRRRPRRRGCQLCALCHPRPQLRRHEQPVPAPRCCCLRPRWHPTLSATASPPPAARVPAQVPVRILWVQRLRVQVPRQPPGAHCCACGGYRPTAHLPLPPPLCGAPPCHPRRWVGRCPTLSPARPRARWTASSQTRRLLHWWGYSQCHHPRQLPWQWCHQRWQRLQACRRRAY